MLARIESKQFRKPVHQEVHICTFSIPNRVIVPCSHIDLCQHRYLHLYKIIVENYAKAKFTKMNDQIMLCPERKFRHLS